MEKSKFYPVGLVIVSVLQIIFLLLHFAGTITWSWAAILSPLWIYGAIILVLSIIIRLLRAILSDSPSDNSK